MPKLQFAFFSRIVLLVLLSVMTIGCSSCPANKPSTDARIFSYMITELRPPVGGEESFFTVVLTNTSGKAIDVGVDDELLFASLKVTNPAGEQYEVFDADYLLLLQTSVWMQRRLVMRLDQSIVWKLSLSSLRTMYGDEVIYQQFRGCRVTSELRISYLGSEHVREYSPMTLASPELLIASP